MIDVPSLRPASARRLNRFALVVGLLCLWPVNSQGQSKSSEEIANAKENRPSGDVQLEVRFTDNSVLKMTLREERVEFITQYGKLYIPITDVRRIELGLRVPDDVAKKIDSAIADLGNTQFRRREAASAILLGFREKAFPAVQRAAKNPDMEIANRAEELIKRFRETVPAELLQARDYDIVHTDTSRIAGHIEANVLKATTTQFGDVPLRLADVFVMSVKGTEPEADTGSVSAAPINMVQYQNEIGKTYSFRVTANSTGSVWGTDVYTTDSTLATVVVHAGLLTAGQTGTVKVTIMPSPQVFVGSTRNGVSSAGYGQFPSAYRVSR